MTGEEILKLEKCGDLFPYGMDKVKERYKELAKKWHPDINHEKNAKEVFEKITLLYIKSIALLKWGAWEKTNYILIPKADGKKIELNYDKMYFFELGEGYISNSKIVYILNSDKQKYYENMIHQVSTLRYANDDMQQKFNKCVPNIYEYFKTLEGRWCIVLEKPKGAVPLYQVLEYFEGAISDRHVAWIISRLSNLCCFLSYNEMVHNGINLYNCFLQPKEHQVFLLGGWWYTGIQGRHMLGTTKEIFSVMSVLAKSKKVSSSLTDLESVKLLARQLLGEENCRKLLTNKEIPSAFLEFVTGGSCSNTYEEFKKWDETLKESYGRRRFVKMDLSNMK